MKSSATRIASQLPGRAKAKVDELLKQVEQRTEPLRAAWSTKFNAPAAVINAAGRLDDPAGAGVPLADEVLAAGLPLLSLSPAAEATARLAAVQSIGRQLGLPPAAVTICSSPSAALIRLDRGGRPGRWLIPRCCGAEETGESDLADWIETCCRGSIREIGAAGGLTADALRAAVSRMPGPPARLVYEAGCLDDDVLAVAAELEVETIAMLTSGRLIGHDDLSAQSLLTAAHRPAALLIAGGVMSGTPPVGILLRPTAAGEASARDAAMDAPAAQTAMVAAAMELALRGELPVDALAAVSIDNLQSRADRLATQLQASGQVAAVRITDHPAMLPRIRRGGNDRPIESRQVVVQLGEGATVDAETLRRRSPSILARMVDNDLAFDLRFVTAEGQGQIAAAVG